MPIFEEPNQNETLTSTIQDSISSGRPTLKDYLNSMKEKNGEFSYQQKNSNNSETDMIVPQLQQFPTAPISHQQHEVQQPNSTNLFRYKKLILAEFQILWIPKFFLTVGGAFLDSSRHSK